MKTWGAWLGLSLALVGCAGSSPNEDTGTDQGAMETPRDADQAAEVRAKEDRRQRMIDLGKELDGAKATDFNTSIRPADANFLNRVVRFYGDLQDDRDVRAYVFAPKAKDAPPVYIVESRSASLRWVALYAPQAGLAPLPLGLCRQPLQKPAEALVCETEYAYDPDGR